MASGRRYAAPLKLLKVIRDPLNKRTPIRYDRGPARGPLGSEWGLYHLRSHEASTVRSLQGPTSFNWAREKWEKVGNSTQGEKGGWVSLGCCAHPRRYWHRRTHKNN
eukprot:1192126-Prorocentrum_minimum.AAC.6